MREYSQRKSYPVNVYLDENNYFDKIPNPVCL